MALLTTGGLPAHALQIVSLTPEDEVAGVRCTVARIAEFKSGTGTGTGTELTGPARYQFNSSGPFVRNVAPSYGKIDEQQFFALELSGPATLASVHQNIWCAVDGVGERVPVRLIEGANRTGLLKSFGQDKAAEKEPLRFVTLQCNRKLTPASRMQIVYGKGVGKMAYTVRLNNVGDFALPPSRVEAMYAPKMFGEVPNAQVKVKVKVAK